jgi:superfamily II DNA/RNA helicase
MTSAAIVPLTSVFADFGVSAPVIEALARRNITDTFPIQARVLPDALAGRDVLARSCTGSGKTLAFAVPMVERLAPTGKPSALVLVPTRELASQVAEEFRGIADVKRLRVAAVYGGVGIAAQVERARRADIVIATPGRLLDLLRRRLLRINRVRTCVLDEADRMLDMGFIPDVRMILSLLPGERQTMLFSATLDGEIGRLAGEFTRDPVLHEVLDERPVVTEARHRFVAVEAGSKFDTLVRELSAERALTLVFVRTKRGAARLARNLKAEGFGAEALHGDMSQAARERSLARFASGKADVLAATDVAARGLDLEHISHVVNFDPPADEKAYVHRVGRTARAGRTGTGVTFVTPDQQADVSKMADALELHTEFADAGLSRTGAPRLKPAGRPRFPQHQQARRRRRRF